MANTLTNLYPFLYSAVDRVSRELVGMVPSVAMNTSAERAAVGQGVLVPVTTAIDSVDIVPAMTVPEPADETVDSRQITITKSKAAPFGFNGEEVQGLNTGPGFNSVQVDMVAQAIRTLVNEVERDCAIEGYQNASRAHGAGGTTPFASNLSDVAQAHRILVDNGAPTSDKQMVIDTIAGANFRTLTQLTNVNQAGDDSLLRQGSLTAQPLQGFTIRESAGIQLTDAGTGTNYLVNNGAGYAVGATAITVDTGTGTILAGDVITFAGDSNKYVVASALAANVVTIAAPGLKVAVADDTAITVSRAGSDFTPNLAFDRNAIQLVTRAPALPQEGDAADDRMMVTDERSGLTFEFSIYRGYKRVRYEVALAWGVKATKPEHIIQLLG